MPDVARAGPPNPPRVAVALLGVTAAPLFLIADTAAAFARGWWTTSSVWLGVVALSAAVVLAATVTALTRRGRSFLSRSLPQLLLLVATLLVGWLLLEVLVGATLGGVLLFHRSAPGVRRVLEPRPDLFPGISGPARYTANSLGLRGPELPPRGEAWRVLCIGGSTTACLYLDDEETWPRVLMRELDGTGGRKVWVGDVGKSGYGSWHHVRFLEDSDLPAQVDCVVVLIGINDYMRAMQGRRIDSGVGTRPLWDHSRVYTVLHNLYQVRKEERQHRVEEHDGGNLELWRSQWRSAPRCDDLPDLTEGLEQYRTNVRSMIGLLRASGTRPVFAAQPVLWSARMSPRARDLLWLGSSKNGVPPPEKLLAGMKLFNRALEETCATEGVECVDLASMDGNEAFFYDDCHFTEAGAREVARLIGTALRNGRPATRRSRRRSRRGDRGP